MPTLTQQDRDRLQKTGILDRWTTCSRKLNEVNPNVKDLKRLFIMEIEREHPRENIKEKLLVRLQKREREQIISRVDATS